MKGGLIVFDCGLIDFDCGLIDLNLFRIFKPLYVFVPLTILVSETQKIEFLSLQRQQQL